MRRSSLLLLACCLHAGTSRELPSPSPALAGCKHRRLDGAPSLGRNIRPAVLGLRGGALRGSVKEAARRLLADSRTRVGKHMRGVVFGGMDGILTTFALIAALSGSSQMSTSVVLVIGTSTILADALSMAAGEYLSAKAEDELEPGSSDDGEPGPLEKGFAMFLAFTSFGAMPLVGFLVAASLSHGGGGTQRHFLMSIGVTAVMLFGLGTIKSKFGPGSWWRSGLEVSAIGGAAASVAYFTAQLTDRLLGHA